MELIDTIGNFNRRKLERFNRIIDLTFITRTGQVRRIYCPRRGRKPSIEINGTYTARSTLSQLNITVKNLYLDLADTGYTTLKIDAGYEGNTVSITGQIVTIYQDSPGPDGKTVIQVNIAKIGTWLNEYIDLNYETGTPLIMVLNSIKSKLKISQLKIGVQAATLKLDSPFWHHGTAREAITKLESRFEDKGLAIFVRSNKLCAVCENKDFANVHVLQYMSAPAQPNTGGEKGTYYTTITAPWMPELDLFDKLIIPARTYVKDFKLVAGLIKKQTIRVTALSFHFSTTGRANQMTVQGSNI